MQVIKSFTVTRNIDMAMRDGVKLRADLWMPQVEGEVPAVLVRTPYDKGRSNSDMLRPQQLAEAGFAVVIQDCRGRFASEGAYTMTWAGEGPDTYDSVEWIASQPWCSGAVGMYGGSYLGVMQLQGAMLKPPHLKAIAPSLAPYMPVDKIEVGGGLRFESAINWLAFMSVDWLQAEMSKGRQVDPQWIGQIMAAVANPSILLQHRPIKDIPLFRIPGFPVTFESFLEGMLSLDVDAAKFEIPVFQAGGWYDLYARSTVAMYQEQRASKGRAADAVHLLMGPWQHAPHLPQMQGHVNFGYAADATYGGVPEALLAFFSKYLRGDQVDLPRVRYFMMNANDWRNTDAWPPQDVQSRRWFLSSGALVEDAGSVKASTESYIYDPADPTPNVGGRAMAWSTIVGPVDQRPTDHRKDILRYTSQPLAKVLDIAGPVRAALTVSTSAVDTDFVAKLIDVDSSGVALPVTEGVVRMRFRKGFGRTVPVVPDQKERIVIELADVAWRVLPGHRLRLQVQSASYPHLDANPNTGNPIGVDQAGIKATNRVHHEPENPPTLDLTVLPG
jgi:putative CocE/NonD family hydrolase